VSVAGRQGRGRGLFFRAVSVVVAGYRVTIRVRR
jgi:hypothetical protein